MLTTQQAFDLLPKEVTNGFELIEEYKNMNTRVFCIIFLMHFPRIKNRHINTSLANRMKSLLVNHEEVCQNRLI